MGKKKIRRPAESAGEKLSFEEALARLERTVADLEDGQLGLDESLVQYEKGIKYLKQCFRQLARAQGKIELLAEINENGEARAVPFDEADMTLEQKQAARSRRRSQGGNPAADVQPESEPGMDDGGTLF